MERLLIESFRFMPNSCNFEYEGSVNTELKMPIACGTGSQEALDVSTSGNKGAYSGRRTNNGKRIKWGNLNLSHVFDKLRSKST